MPDPNQPLPTRQTPASHFPPTPRKTSWVETAGPRIDAIARIACLSAGCALVVAAIVALFVDTDTGALIAVLVAGVVLVLLPSVVDRLRSFRAGQFEIQLMAQIASTARKSAETLRRLGMESELNAYAAIYTEMRGPELQNVRGQVLDRIVQRVSNASAVEKFDPGEVKDLFRYGAPIVRVLALGLMEGDLSLIDSGVLLEAIGKPLTGNEQYHALKVVLYGWGRLSPDERTALRAAINTGPQIESGPGRAALAQQIREL
jgi:hypothetical protein